MPPVITTDEIDFRTLPPHLQSLGEPIYNGLDSCITHEVHGELESMQGLPGADTAAANNVSVYGLERALQGPVLDMMLRGFRVDPYARDLAMRNAEAKLLATERVFSTLTQAICDRDFNSNSPVQLKNLFYDVMGLKRISSWVKGESKEQMNRETLEKLEVYFYARPLVNCALVARDLNKTLQVLRTEIDPDWRWRCSYNIAGTDSWRFSSSKSSIGSGSNFQNITSDLRRVFIPDPGFKLAGIDKEQAESREVGFLCGILFDDWSYLDATESGDLHTTTARLIWPDLPWTGDMKADRKIAEQPFYRHYTYRDMSKRCGHGTNYVGKPLTLSQILKIPIRFVEDFQTAYFDAFPCIPRMHHWVARELQSKMYLVNVFGARRDFFDRPKSDETLRSAVAHMFQSATAMDLNLGMWRIWRYMPDRVQLLAQLHDAVYFQYREDDNEAEVLSEAQRLLDVELRCRGRKFIVPTEVKVGHNWSPRYKLDADGHLIDWNPNGLDRPKGPNLKDD